jgi:hypothetical protein
MGVGRQCEPPKVTEMLPFEKRKRVSGREKVDRIQRGDDLTTDQQLLQIVAVAQCFVRQDAKPEVVSSGAGRVRFNDSRVQHNAPFSSGRAMGNFLGYGNSENRQAKMKMGGQRDSNPQQPEPQSGALPLSYGHRRVRT